MAKYAQNTLPSGLVKVKGSPSTRTYEGAPAYIREARSELFVTAVSSLMEDTYYESNSSRRERIAALVHSIVSEGEDGQEFVARLVPYLRNELFLRSISVVIACEYVAAGGKGGRKVISAACSRADEPAEILGYWMRFHGRNVPKPVKRGVADAAERLYSEFSLLKYDGSRKDWRFGDVIDLVHPTPKGEWQSALFKYALDIRHDREEFDVTKLPAIQADLNLRQIPESERRAALNGPYWETAKWSWERVSGWLPGGMDKDAWEALIPTMGYMALLRNLRNFDEAGVSKATCKKIADRLADPEEVARSKQMPFRFLSAYETRVSEKWTTALEEALELSIQNIPSFPGKTLVLIDASGSMAGGYFGNRSKRAPKDLASLFGFALAKRCEDVDVYSVGTDWRKREYNKSLLSLMESFQADQGGTYFGQAIRATQNNHDRIIALSDGQWHDSMPVLPKKTTYVQFNVVGYSKTPVSVGSEGKYEIAGMTDAAFKLLPLLEKHRAGAWPHMV